MRRPIRELCPARTIVCSSRSPTRSLPGACRNSVVRLLGVSFASMDQGVRRRLRDFWATVSRTVRSSASVPTARPSSMAPRIVFSISLRVETSSVAISGRMAARRSVSSATSSRPMNATSISLSTERLGFPHLAYERGLARPTWPYDQDYRGVRKGLFCPTLNEPFVHANPISGRLEFHGMIFGSWRAGNWKLKARAPGREEGPLLRPIHNGPNWLMEPVPGDGFLLLTLGSGAA